MIKMIEEFKEEFGEEEVRKEGVEIGRGEVYEFVKELTERNDEYELRISHRRIEKSEQGYNFKPFGVQGIDYKAGEYTISEDFGHEIIVQGRGIAPMFTINLNYYLRHTVFESDNWIDLILVHYEDGEGDEFEAKDSIHFLFRPVD